MILKIVLVSHFRQVFNQCGETAMPILTWWNEKVVNDMDDAIAGQYIGFDRFSLVELQWIKRNIHLLPKKSLERTSDQILTHVESGSNVIKQKFL